MTYHLLLIRFLRLIGHFKAINICINAILKDFKILLIFVK